MEFVIKTDLAVIPSAIDFNAEEIKEEISARLEAYNSLVITEDGIKGAKADRATLNKLKTAIEDKRKEVKKICLAPYEEFEKKCKEIVNLVDQPIRKIDEQLNAFEEKAIQEKYNQISDYYSKNVGELADLIPIAKVLPVNWKNKTESLESICNSIGDMFDKIRSDLKTIRDLNTEFEQSVISVYLDKFNLSAALQENTRLTEQKAKMQKAVPVQKSASVQEEPQQVQTEELQQVQTEEPLYQASFRVTGTKKQLQLLKLFFEKYEVKYEKI